MAKRKKLDVAENALRIVEQAIGERLVGGNKIESPGTEREKRGSSGGRKGGPARAAKLSSRERSRIARKAAKARWNQVD